jgi:hypothetical protein
VQLNVWVHLDVNGDSSADLDTVKSSMKRGRDREPQSSLREILCVLQKNIRQNLELKKSGFFYLHEFLSSTG